MVTYSDHMLDHDSPEPLYVQLADLLRQEIRKGTLVSRVPSVRSLAQEHGVSHITAARALEILKGEGLIVSASGKGFYVKRLDLHRS